MTEEKSPAVYILASDARGTLYVGVTSALWNRVATHKDGTVSGFMDAAIHREKQIKKWNREWKVKMIEALNPNWVDLHDDIDPTRFYEERKLGSRLRGNDELTTVIPATSSVIPAKAGNQLETYRKRDEHQ